MAPITWAVVLLAGLTCILGQGTQTELETYPSIVQVEDLVLVAWLQQCVGNVITNFHILSAASCFPDENTAIRRIRAGASTRGVGGVVNEISKITHHPSYGQMGRDGDLAMIVLASALTLSSTIAQAAIIGDGIYLPENLQMALVGWGTTAEGSLVGDDNLYSLDVYTVNEEDCIEKYIGQQIVTENMICVRQLGSSGRDFDSRDAGAPLIYGTTTSGILSFGVSHGGDDFPVVSTALTSYTAWIIDAASQL